MRLTQFISIAALSVLAVAATQAANTTTQPDPNGNLIGLTTPNGKLVYDFINMWFNEHKAEAAWDKYVARKGYMNHAVYNATKNTVNKTFEEEKAEEARAAGPGTVFKIKQLIAQGNLVFVHIAASRNDGIGAATGLPAVPAPAPSGAPAAGMAGGAPPAGAQGGMAAGGGPGASGDGKGDDEMVMILRVKDGKIVDHWDMHVPTNSDSVVFEGLDRQLP